MSTPVGGKEEFYDDDHDEKMLEIYGAQLLEIYDKLKIEKDPLERAYLKEERSLLKEQRKSHSYNIWKRDNL